MPFSIASSSETLSPCSFKLFSVEKTKLSAWFLASTVSLFFYLLLCLLQHLLPFFVFLHQLNRQNRYCSFPVPLFSHHYSIGVNIKCNLNLWSTSWCWKINSKFPSILLSAAISLSPCNTLIDTAGFSSAVEKTFFCGIVVFFLLIL